MIAWWGGLIPLRRSTIELKVTTAMIIATAPAILRRSTIELKEAWQVLDIRCSKQCEDLL